MLLIYKFKNIPRKVFKASMLLVKYVLYFFSGFVNRSERVWVFGSFGDFNDNSRYLYEYIYNNSSLYGIKAVWVSNRRGSVAIAKRLGFESYMSWSIKGIYYCLIAKVYIYSAYVSDINLYTSKGAILVNLWHGIPLKKIEFDIETKPLVDIFKNATLITKFREYSRHVKADMVLSPSKYVAQYSFISAFRLRGMVDIIHCKYPRVVDLLICEPLFNFKKNNEFVFLYAPTWRDSGNNFIDDSKIEFSRLNDILKGMNAKILIKLHPATKIKIDNSFECIKLVDNMLDPNRLMKTADCLITDYSSIFFDYMYLDRPIIFFAFDKDEYLSGREFYLEYDQCTPGEKVFNFDELLICMMDVRNSPDNYYDDMKYKTIKDKFISDTNCGDNDNIVRTIKRKVKNTTLF